MGKHLFKFEGVFEVVMLFKLLTICMNMATSYGQPGFLSLDCGSGRDNYTDDIGLSWVNDERYIGTGSNSYRPFKVNSSVWDNAYALEYFRYFPEPRNKYCYDLPTDSNVSYLIRVMFYYDESEYQLLRVPIEFNVFINTTKWFTMDYTEYLWLESSSGSTFPGMYGIEEGIFYSPGGVIYFCLQPVKGIPFISSLELRRLDPEGIMYKYLGSNHRYLSLQTRSNYGASWDSPTVRYPDDPFDRFWYGETYDTQITNGLSAPDAATSVDLNNIPTKVMLDAERLNNISLHLRSTESDIIYVAVYFGGLFNLTESREQVVTIDVYNDDGAEVSASKIFNVTNKASMQIFPNLVFGGSSLFLDFTRADPPSDSVNVNALEVYGEHTFDISTTNPHDAWVIKVLQRSFNLNSWHGDPCLPVTQDWLKCRIGSDYEVAFIHSITLSYLSGNGWPSLMNTSYHNFVLYSLDQISLTHSEISNANFQFLIENFTIKVSTLNLSYNIISDIPPSSSWTFQVGLRYLDLSHNALKGALPLFTMSFINISQNLKILNVSNNNLTKVHPDDLHFSNVSNLQTINFDRNIIQGTLNLTSWYESLQQNATLPGPLFTFVNNLIMDIIPSIEVLESTIVKRMVDKDPHFNETGVLNNIQGTLNLITWYESLQQNESFHGPLFTITNNQIKDLCPTIEVLKPITAKRMLDKDFNNTGVLLGGNPYCKGVKSLTHQYLCRYKITDIVHIVHQDKEKNNTLLLVGIIGGILLFIICCVLFAISWKLWKKVSALQKIQQALADQKVKPPFYDYSELKFATKDFHKNNKLGNGAFGVVYKGVLPDGSILAIKKLFNSRQVQVLNEYLNEVVLITGIKHRNLVQLKGCCINDQQRILVYEYVENGNLAEALWGKEKPKTIILDWRQCFNICVGVARGLLYLHEELQPRIIHRDIKPANILLDKNLNPKIADFGLARRFLDEQSRAQFTNIAGTRGYWAPEYASEGKLTEKADVFSFGILVLEIVSGRKAIDYDMPSERVFLKDWVQKLHQDGMLLEVLQPDLPQNYVEDEVMRVINIALICVQMDSERRASMSQVVTMLLGSMDVTVFLDIGNQHQPDFNILFQTNESQSVSDISSFHKYNAIVEDCDESPLRQVDLESSLPNHSSITTHSIATIELSDMSGR